MAAFADDNDVPIMKSAKYLRMNLYAKLKWKQFIKPIWVYIIQLLGFTKKKN